MRFPEFQEEWYETEIKNILKIGSGRDYKHLETGNIPVFGTGGYMTSINDFLYDGESVCIGRKGTINKPFYLKGKFWTVDTLFYTYSYKNVQPKFLFYTFEQINWLKYNEASGVPSLSKSTIETILIAIPKKEEQDKIATFLSLIDERIETQNKIIEKLESLIKGLSNRLFCECFVNEKLITLKSISSAINRRNDEKEDYPIMMIAAEHGFINQSEKYSGDNAGNSLSKYTLLKQGELAYNRGSSRNKKYGSVFFLNYPNALVPYVYHSFKMNSQICDVIFYAYLLNSKLLNKELRKIISSTARMDGLLNISKEDFFSIKVPLPKLEKQQLISTSLNKLMQKTKLEKDVVTKYQKQKQYILQQMFI